MACNERFRASATCRERSHSIRRLRLRTASRRERGRSARAHVPFLPVRVRAALPRAGGNADWRTLRYECLTLKRGELMYRLGVDVGGTFTDFTVFGEKEAKV